MQYLTAVWGWTQSSFRLGTAAFAARVPDGAPEPGDGRQRPGSRRITDD